MFFWLESKICMMFFKDQKQATPYVCFAHTSMWTSNHMDIIVLRTRFLNQNISIFRFSSEWFSNDEWISFQVLDHANILKSNIGDIRHFLQNNTHMSQVCIVDYVNKTRCKQNTEQVHLQRKLINEMRDEVLIRITRRNPN